MASPRSRFVADTPPVIIPPDATQAERERLRFPVIPPPTQARTRADIAWERDRGLLWWEERFNPNHDELGRFSSGDGSDAAESEAWALLKQGEEGGGGSIQAAQHEAAAAVAGGGHAAVSASEAHEVIHEIAELAAEKGVAANLSNLHIAGADHGNLLDYSATETPREAMPQIGETPQLVAAYKELLDSRGIGYREEMISPTDLHATQNQLDAGKVDGIAHWIASDGGRGMNELPNPLFVANDGALIDGHHRWAGAALYAVDSPLQVPVIRLDTDVHSALALTQEYDVAQGIVHKTIGTGSVSDMAKRSDDRAALAAKARENGPDDPPSDDKPWLYLNGRWVLIATDTQDGIPDKLDMPPKQVVNTTLNSEKYAHKARGPHHERAADIWWEERFNPNHDELGRFSSTDGGSSDTGAADGEKSIAALGQISGLQTEWATLEKRLDQVPDDPRDPRGSAVIGRQKEIIDEIHRLQPQANPERDARQLVIVGGGPAGLTAGIYGGSEGLDTLVLESKYAVGGQFSLSSRIENYPGFPAGVSGQALATKIGDQADRFAQVEPGKTVTGMSVDPQTGIKTLELNNGEKIESHAVVIAGGVQSRALGVPGEDSPSVSYNDGAELAHDTGSGRAIIVGGGNSAGQAAAHVAEGKAEGITILTRSGEMSSSTSDYLVQKIATDPKIEVAKGEVRSIQQDDRGRITGVTLKDGSALSASGVGVYIGSAPKTDWAAAIERNSKGEILTGRSGSPLETNVPGVFAVGDVREGTQHRVATAAGDGAFVVSQVHNYLRSR